MPEDRAIRVLVCVSSDVHARVQGVMRQGNALFAANVEDALHALTHADFDLLLIGMRFDESRGLELMQHISANTTFPRVPIVGVRDADPRRAASPRAFDVPMRTLGARDVVDLAALPKLLGGLSPP